MLLLQLMTMNAQAIPTLTRSHTFQVMHRVNLFDAGVGEDFLTNPRGRYPARWAEVSLCVPGSGEACATQMTDEGGWVTFDGVDPNAQYEMVLHAHHDIGDVGRDLWIHSDQFDPEGSVFSVRKGPFDISSTSDMIAFDAAVDDDGDGEPDRDWINVAAVASWVMHRNKAVWPVQSNDHLYSIWVEDGNDTKFNPSTLSVHIDTSLNTLNTTHGRQKYIIAHEMGHMLHYALTFPGEADSNYWDNRIALDYSAVDGDTACLENADTHYLLSKEYQSAAIVEGYAHFVAARAFNRRSEDDCAMAPNGAQTWRPDLGIAYTDEAYSCEGHPDDAAGAEWTVGTVDGGDFLGDYCSDGPTYNRGVELDWLRFFWDVHTKAGLSFGQIADVLEEADGRSWNAADTGPVSSFPRVRIRQAFLDLGHWDAWNDYQNSNGVGH